MMFMHLKKNNIKTNCTCKKCKQILNMPFVFVQDAFVTIARTEGVTSLWSGLPPTL